MEASAILTVFDSHGMGCNNSPRVGQLRLGLSGSGFLESWGGQGTGGTFPRVAVRASRTGVESR